MIHTEFKMDANKAIMAICTLFGSPYYLLEVSCVSSFSYLSNPSLPYLLIGTLPYSSSFLEFTLDSDFGLPTNPPDYSLHI